jgi:hypothetical protein
VPSAPPPPVAALRLRVLRAAGGDAHRAAALQDRMWDAYCTAGRPLGSGSEAMWVWWAHGAGSTSQ